MLDAAMFGEMMAEESLFEESVFEEMLADITPQPGMFVILENDEFYDALKLSTNARLYVTGGQAEQYQAVLDVLGLTNVSLCTHGETEGASLFVLHSIPVFSCHHYPSSYPDMPSPQFVKMESDMRIGWANNHRLDDIGRVVEVTSNLTKLHPTFTWYTDVYIHCDALKDTFFRRLLERYEDTS